MSIEGARVSDKSMETWNPKDANPRLPWKELCLSKDISLFHWHMV